MPPLMALSFEWYPRLTLTLHNDHCIAFLHRRLNPVASSMSGVVWHNSKKSLSQQSHNTPFLRCLSLGCGGGTQELSLEEGITVLPGVYIIRIHVMGLAIIALRVCRSV